MHKAMVSTPFGVSDVFLCPTFVATVYTSFSEFIYFGGNLVFNGHKQTQYRNEFPGHHLVFSKSRHLLSLTTLLLVHPSTILT